MVLDGEIVVCDSRGRPSYDLLAGRLGPKAAKRGIGPIFVAFDLLYIDGRPLISRPLAERRARLLGAGLGSRVLAVPAHLDDDGEPFLEVVEEYGLEGIVAKRRDGRYVPGTRTADWLKCHVTPRADVVVGALVIDEHRGARTLLCGLRGEDGAIAFAGDAYVPPYLGEWLDVATRGFAADASPFATPVVCGAGCVSFDRASWRSSNTRDSRTVSCAMRASAVCDLTATSTIAVVTSRSKSRPTRRTRRAIGPASSF